MLAAQQRQLPLAAALRGPLGPAAAVPGQSLRRARAFWMVLPPPRRCCLAAGQVGAAHAAAGRMELLQALLSAPDAACGRAPSARLKGWSSPAAARGTPAG